MNRYQFIKSLAFIPFTSLAMKLNTLSTLSQKFESTEPMPVLFLGHGSPMNAIEENEFVQGFRSIAQTIARPHAILCISAHWETKGTYVTAMSKPRTIHDFGGFPKELYDVQYPAPGSPGLATETQHIIQKTSVGRDESWGLDHGAWSVIKHMYPQADIPVIQMSLDYTQSPRYHYELGKELAALRRKGILIIGSGNIVHNLGLVAWDKLHEAYAFDWAKEANDTIKQYIADSNHDPLIAYQKQGRAFQLSIPTPDHFLPLLYTLALQEKTDRIELFNDKPIAGSLTMTSVRIG